MALKNELENVFDEAPGVCTPLHPALKNELENVFGEATGADPCSEFPMFLTGMRSFDPSSKTNLRTF
jgi:hypothetical protein